MLTKAMIVTCLAPLPAKLTCSVLPAFAFARVHWEHRQPQLASCCQLSVGGVIHSATRRNSIGLSFHSSREGVESPRLGIRSPHLPSSPPWALLLSAMYEHPWLPGCVTLAVTHDPWLTRALHLSAPCCHHLEILNNFSPDSHTLSFFTQAQQVV